MGQLGDKIPYRGSNNTMYRPKTDKRASDGIGEHGKSWQETRNALIEKREGEQEQTTSWFGGTKENKRAGGMVRWKKRVATDESSRTELD